jgi:putative tryptophan/tyrosine transport system substrate-binding protein
MRRRDFIAGLGGAAVASPLVARAQQARLPVIGFLGIASATVMRPALLPAFHRGLREAGYVEGHNVTIEYFWAEGSYDRLPALAAEAVRRPVDVIVAAGGSIAALVAKRATSTIPVIILAGDDPVRLGLVASINRPGGNVTGVAQLVVASEGKRLELLRELVPTAKRVAMLANPRRENSERQMHELQAGARTLGLTLHVVEAAADDDLVPALAAARSQADAVIVAADPYFFARHDRIVGLAASHALPTMYFFREFVVAGGLISYGSNLAAAFREIGGYAGKVLRGENPREMPMVQQSDKLELVINLNTAKTLGLEIPPTLLARADEVIE